MKEWGELKLKVFSENGYEEGLLGLSLSYYREGTDIDEWWKGQKPKAIKRATKQSIMGGGHSKFISAINVQILLTATRSFWQEFDQYNFTVTNSASTMHTLSKERVNRSHFIQGTSPILIDNLNMLIDKGAEVNILKANLPEGYLQTRMITTNYMSLQTIYHQRKTHRLLQWRTFCDKILEQLEHPELIIGEMKYENKTSNNR